MPLIENQKEKKIDIEEIKKSLPFPVNVSYGYNILTVLGDAYEFIIHLNEKFGVKYIRYFNPGAVDDKNFLFLLRNLFGDVEWIKILTEKEINILSVLYEEKEVPHKEYIELVSSLEDVAQVYVEDRYIQIFLWSPSDRGVFSCSHLIRYIIVKLYQIFSNIQYSPQVSLVQGSLIP
jgi:hypothetical protein